MVKFKPLNVRPQKSSGQYIFSNFDIGLYHLDTPRFIGEQLASLALVGGRNVWTEKGALVPQYGYQTVGRIPEDEVIALVTKDSLSSSSFFIVTYYNTETKIPNVYLYTAAQGLKKYKTPFTQSLDLSAAHRAKDMIISSDGQVYMFGAYYDDPAAEVTTINDDITLDTYSSYYQFTIPIDDLIYYWNGKDLVVNGEDHITVTSATVLEGADVATIKAVSPDGIKIYPEAVSIGERTLLPIELIYIPEDYDEEDPDSPQPQNISPQLVEVCTNRLCVVDISGRIYYSQVGVMDGFQEVLGAGYFEGFYNSTSKVLSIEDYLNGALISKEDGIYYLTLGETSYQTVQTGSEGQGTLSLSNNPVSIKKIAQIGQQYATDHIVVRDQVFAYDTYSGSIVLAAHQNIYGNIVSGDTIIDARALDSLNSGISSTPRWLTYNARESIFTLYYGEQLNYGVVLKTNTTLFPRELDKNLLAYVEFNQGVIGITRDNEIIQDFTNGTVIENLPANAVFEAIGVRDNRLICCSMLEVTELNGVSYEITTQNAGVATQLIQPVISQDIEGNLLPPLIYSDYKNKLTPDSFELLTKWAAKKSSVTRMYAPMSGREGVQISIEFPKNTTFCLVALRLPDFSQGE